MPESLSKQYKKRKSMKKEENNLDRLKGTNPFTVPEGYMEGLTERIMSQLPEKQEERAKRISLMDRVRPWCTGLRYSLVLVCFSRLSWE